MPWDDDDEEGRLSSHTAWRALIVVIGVILILVIAGGVALAVKLAHTIEDNRAAINSTRDLSCRVGSFFVGEPVVRQPEQTKAQFHHEVAKAIAFLQALKEEDCTDVAGAAISSVQIHHALRHLKRAIGAPIRGRSPQAAAASPSSPGSVAALGAPASSPAEGEPSPAASAPASRPRPPSPPATTTAPAPTTTTTATSPAPAPRPGAVGRVHRLVCDLAGRVVCNSG